MAGVVHSYGEKQVPRAVFHNEYRPGRHVLAGNNAVKVDEGKPGFHGDA
jgi:hypothetical protein